MKKAIILGIICHFLLVGKNYATDVYNFERELVLPEDLRDGIAVVELDEHVLQHSRADFSDLVLLDGGAERELDFALEKITTRQTSMQIMPISCELSGLSIESATQQSIEIMVAENEKFQPSHLELIAAGEDFSRKVSVQASADRQNWHEVGAGMIFSHRKIAHWQNLRIDISGVAARFYRLIIDEDEDLNQRFLAAASGKNVEITREIVAGKELKRWEKTSQKRNDFFPINEVRLFGWQQSPPRTIVSKFDYAVDFSAPKTLESGDVVIEISSKNLPLSELKLDFGARNFMHQARLQAQDDNGNWRQIARATIADISFGDFSQRQRKIDFPAIRAPQLRLIIAAGARQDLQLQNIAARGEGYRLLLPTSNLGQKPILRYNLRADFGAKIPSAQDTKPAAKNQIDEIIARLRHHDAPQNLLKLAPPQSLQPTAKANDFFAKIAPHLGLIALLVATAFLSFLLFKFSRKIPPQN